MTPSNRLQRGTGPKRAAVAVAGCLAVAAPLAFVEPPVAPSLHEVAAVSGGFLLVTAFGAVRHHEYGRYCYGAGLILAAVLLALVGQYAAFVALVVDGAGPNAQFAALLSAAAVPLLVEWRDYRRGRSPFSG